LTPAVVEEKNIGVMKLCSYLPLFVFLMASVSLGASKIKVQPAVEQVLSVLLRGANSLHGALYKEDERRVKELIPQLSKAVDLALSLIHKNESQESRIHLEKLLETTKARLTDYQNFNENQSEKKQYYLREFYQQMTQIARSFDLDYKPKIFFCSKDRRAVWVQTGRKAQNPFNPAGNLKSCGVIMN